MRMGHFLHEDGRKNSTSAPFSWGGVQRYEYSFRGKMVGWLAVAVAFAVASAFAAAASAAAATAATASATQHVHRLAVLLG